MTAEARPDRAAHRRTPPPHTGLGGPVVVQPMKRQQCAECRREPLDLLTLEDGAPRCLDCADLGHLVYLPRGDWALTRRAGEGSSLSAVVVRFHRRRGRYERQGVLVEEAALARAEERCLADADARARRRARDAVRRAAQDASFTAAFAREILRLFPGCPPDRAEAIAAHASLRGSGRVGRSAAGRALSQAAVTAAVRAAVRHTETAYDALLMSGVGRGEARRRIAVPVEAVLAAWRARGS
ncbi:DUF2293 domain-containing protein [Streptomyces sp. NPDC058430]|uniref:DUF2293 domain-containing protein n=1 Tax=Streptomyces sp. NPDC058430 TaxID=3346495 RepID=UPI00365BB220